MPRVEPLRREDLPQYEDQFALIESVMGFLPTSLLTMARSPALLQHLTGLVGAATTMGHIDPPLVHLVSHVASRAAGCTYCQAHTATHGGHAGVPAEKLDAVWEFEFSELYTPAEQAALRLARDAALVPNATSDAHFDELRRHYDDDAIVQIVAVISAFGFLNRWNDTMATRLEDVPRSFAEDHLTDMGWRAGRHA